MKMNNLIKLTSLLVLFSACDDVFEPQIENNKDLETLLVVNSNAMGLMIAGYARLPYINGTEYDVATDDAVTDEIFNPEADNRMTHQVDLGNFRAWRTTGNWLYRDGSDPAFSGVNCNAGKTHSLWPHSWYCIRKCNMAIDNIDKMMGTEEERDLILGQAYFFRAWWHFELMEYFGGLPYISKTLDPSNIEKLPRLSFQDCADSCARDFRRAADLLPINWDNISAGTDYGTGGKNELRVNKITALGYLGKCLLWAGSPLMANNDKGELGGAKTYDYDQTYCQRAAESFGELLSMVENGETQYALVEFNYSKVYDHEKAKGAKTSYSDLFYTTKQSWKLPGSTEAIMRGLSGGVDQSGPNANNSNWNTSKVFGPKGGIVEHDNTSLMSTQRHTSAVVSTISTN